MTALYFKEIKQFFNALTGILIIGIFLLMNGLFLFLFSETSVLDFGFVSLDYFFDITPYTLIILIAAITMRQFSDEFKSGTFELLATISLSKNNIVFSKFFASLTIVIFSLLPTLVYAFSLSRLANSEIGFDKGAIFASYIGLLLLSMIYIAIGLFCSSLSNNSIVAFLVSCVISYFLYNGFEQFVALNLFDGNTQFVLENFGIAYHFKSMKKGVIDIKDLIYFLSCIWFFVFICKQKLNINK